MRRVWWVCVFMLAAPVVYPQTTQSTEGEGGHPEFEPRADLPEAVTLLSPLLLPKIFQDEYRLKEYICSPEFGSLRGRYGDVCAVDAVFDRAVRLSWNNLYEALFISFLATMEHRNFGVNLGLLGALIWVPLTAEFPEQFQLRVAALPSSLYPDSPPEGDRDTLQHFFGSAFLTYLFESREAADRVGLFIEWGEEEFIVDGSLDERDLRANRQGQQFGLRLLQDAAVLPSMSLRFVLASRPNESLEHHAPDAFPDSAGTTLEEK
jgi:hypothetical protein